MKSKPWLATYRDEHPGRDRPRRVRSVVDLLEEAMNRFADKTAFRCAGQTLSYADVDRLSRDFAAYLQRKLGVKKGDRIAVMMPNLLAFPIAFLGIVRAGAVQVNVNPLYTPRELEHQLNDAGVETIVVFTACRATLAEVIGQDRAEDRHHRRRRRRQRRALPSPPVDARLAGAIALRRRAGRRRQAAASAPVELDRRRPAVPAIHRRHHRACPRARALSHRNLVANTEQFKAFMPDSVRPGEEVIVTAIPLYHIFALMVNFITYFSVGAENWLVANPRDIDGFIETLKQARPTVFIGVNTLYAGLAAHPQQQGGRLVAPAPVGRRRRRGDRAPSPTGGRRSPARFIREGYGLSETSPVLSLQPGLRAASSPAPPACRCPRPTSSCSTTTATKSRSAKPARSASRARR